MTLTELVQGRRAAIAATAAVVTATVGVTALLAGAGDDGAPQPRTGDSLGAEPTDSPTPSPTAEPTPEATTEATAAATASRSTAMDEDEGREPTPRPSATDVSTNADGPYGYGGGTCGPSEPEPSSGSRQAEQSPEQSPSASPTSTEVAPTEPAPPTASASSTSEPGTAEPTTSPTPTGTATTTCVVVGRPMRRDGDLLVPEVRGGTVDDLPRPDVSGLDPRDRQALAELWTQAARGELASVPAFHDLALVLSALGAPLDLVARATQAALDEVDHTRRAFAIAGAYAGAPVEGGAVPGLLGRRVGQASTPRAALTRLAVEALRDGCLHEGGMAAVARLAADGADDPDLRASLDVIATDEAGHAVLSFDVLAWCLSAGDSRLRSRIVTELAGLPVGGPDLPQVDADPEVLARHGWPTSYDVARVFAAHRLAVVARVEGLLVGSL